jgi:hypothetical protein
MLQVVSLQAQIVVLPKFLSTTIIQKPSLAHFTFTTQLEPSTASLPPFHQNKPVPESFTTQ